MREFRTYGSVRGAHGNGRPYRNCQWAPKFPQKWAPKIPKVGAMVLSDQP